MEDLKTQARQWNRVYKLLKQNVTLEDLLENEPWLKTHIPVSLKKAAAQETVPIPDAVCQRVRKLCGLSPTEVDTIAQLINLPEQGNTRYDLYYNYIELGDDRDIRGYTVTIFGACSGTGDLLHIFEQLEKINPRHALLKYLPALRKAKGGNIKGIEGLGHVNGDPKKAKANYANFSADAPRAHLDHIDGDLARLPLGDTDWQLAVWTVFIDLYWESAMHFCAKTGACADRPGPRLTTTLALAFLVDTCLNHGPASYWNSTAMWGFMKKLPAVPTEDEHEFLRHLIHARRVYLRSGYGGLDWSKTGDRCLLYAKLLEEENYDLQRPIQCADSTAKPFPIWQPGQVIARKAPL